MLLQPAPRSLATSPLPEAAAAAHTSKMELACPVTAAPPPSRSSGASPHPGLPGWKRRGWGGLPGTLPQPPPGHPSLTVRSNHNHDRRTRSRRRRHDPTAEVEFPKCLRRLPQPARPARGWLATARRSPAGLGREATPSPSDRVRAAAPGGRETLPTCGGESPANFAGCGAAARLPQPRTCWRPFAAPPPSSPCDPATARRRRPGARPDPSAAAGSQRRRHVPGRVRLWGQGPAGIASPRASGRAARLLRPAARHARAAFGGGSAQLSIRLPLLRARPARASASSGGWQAEASARKGRSDP